VTRLHAVRVAARVRREFQVDVDVVGGPYGQFGVMVDGRTVLEGGRLAMLGVLPTSDEVLAAVRSELKQGTA
jgi:hypothetical protein